jgi:hypothetical protein
MFNPRSEVVIACISSNDLKESIELSQESCLEQMINFIKDIPGFKNLSKTVSKKLLKQFNIVRVKKGWTITSDQIKSQKKVFVIYNGQFSFLKYNQNINN